MKYKIRKFQNPSSTLQYFGNLNQQAQDKNNSAESRVGRAFGITNNEEQGKKPASNYRTTKGGRTVANYVNDKHVDNPQWATDVGNALTDTGTMLIHGINTFGSSVVGDVVKGFSPNAANWLEKSTLGIISQTPQEKLERNRQGGNWDERVTDIANSVSTAVGFGALGGIGKAAIGTKAGQGLLASKLGRNITKQGTGFMPKDTRFLVNQGGYKMPNIGTKPKINSSGREIVNTKTQKSSYTGLDNQLNSNKFNSFSTEEIKAIKNKEIEWLKNPEYIKRKMEATGKSKERVIKESNKMTQKLRNTDVNFVDEIEDGAGALYTAGIGKTNPRVTVWKAPNKKHGESLLSHEIKHASSEAAILKDPLFEVFNSSYKKYPKLSVSNKWYDNPTLAISEKAYYNDPREQQVIARRIMDIIENEQGIKRGTKITRGNFDVLRNSLNTQNKAKDTHNADIMSMLQQFKHKFGQTEYIDKTIDFINKAYSNPVITIPTVGAIGLGGINKNK